MSKVLARSAAILDEADRFEGILNWQLFTAEQETKLWGYNPETTWTPGEPLYPNPISLAICDCGGPYCTPPRSDGYEGNVVRPMIQEYRDGEDYDSVLCKACEVWWNVYENPKCWMCGEHFTGEVEPRPLFDLETFGMQPYIYIHDSDDRMDAHSENSIDQTVLRFMLGD